ncbi:MAG TPA: DUF4405 domain-containing protein [Xanthobacteraceae bacterium]|jgi:hypothetical protein|nr:DUF4405 domain-containing protein [Xanthobacteraceae bacterium]
MTTSETTIEKPAASLSPGATWSKLLNRLATPLTAGLFTVSAISGTALFFRWAPGAFHTMHVWLSMVLLAPFLLHVLKNWQSLMGYAKRGTLIVPLAVCLIVALPFVYAGLNGARGSPSSRAVRLMTQVPLSNLAPVLKSTPEALLAALRKQGYGADSASDTLEKIAAASGKQGPELLFALLPLR